MLDEQTREKVILLLVMSLISVIIIFGLRSVNAGGTASSFFRLMTVIMVALLGICVYRFVKS